MSLIIDCDLAALDQPGAATVVGTLKLTVGEKTGWFAGLECRYFGKRPLTEDGACRSPATGLLNVAPLESSENPYVNGPYGMPLAKQLAGIKGQAVRPVSNAPRFGTTIWRIRPVKPVY